MEKKSSNFSGQIGFVLAAAGSAVGVGNLWRFPYLAAKDGGGLFLLVYLVLVLTFGFTLLTSDIAIGRRTKQSAIGAYAQMRPKWKFLGILFFVTAIFATLTSCISVLESITANCMEIFHSGRKKTVLVLAVIYLAVSAIIALGYSIFYFEVQLPNGSVGQLLDIMDYISNSVMMPFIALLSTILIGWVMTPDYVIDEMQRNGETFRRKKLYRVMIRYVAPVMMLVLFLQSTGILA